MLGKRTVYWSADDIECFGALLRDLSLMHRPEWLNKDHRVCIYCFFFWKSKLKLPCIDVEIKRELNYNSKLSKFNTCMPYITGNIKYKIKNKKLMLHDEKYLPIIPKSRPDPSALHWPVSEIVIYSLIIVDEWQALVDKSMVQRPLRSNQSTTS